MSTTSAGPPSGSGTYEIRLKGHLSARWTVRFDGMTLTSDRDGTTVLRGEVTDQAVLHGLLTKIRDLGLPLLSVVAIASNTPHTTDTTDTTDTPEPPEPRPRSLT